MERQAADGALPTGVTADQLRAAVGVSRSWRGVLREVGLTSPRQGRRLKQACDVHGIDYRHFRSRRTDDDDVAQAVAGAASWAQVLHRLGHAPDSGSARASVRAHCARLGVDSSHLGAPPVPGPADPLRDTPDLKNLRTAGAFIVAAACTLCGYRVSWPIEPAPYDLLVEGGDGGLHRVQVKTTTVRSGSGWVCDVSRSTYVPGGTKKRAHYDPDEVDVFGIVDGDLAVYFIPARLAIGTTSLSLAKYAGFRSSPPLRGDAEGTPQLSG
jgi:hypothetical protein